MTVRGASQRAVVAGSARLRKKRPRWGDWLRAGWRASSRAFTDTNAFSSASTALTSPSSAARRSLILRPQRGSGAHATPGGGAPAGGATALS